MDLPHGTCVLDSRGATGLSRSRVKLDSNADRRRGILTPCSPTIRTKGRTKANSSSSSAPTQAVAELMAECPSCGAITSFALELAWQLDVVSCSECNRVMRLDEVDLDGFRERLKDATARV